MKEREEFDLNEKTETTASDSTMPVSEGERDKLIKELWELWENLAECGQVSIGKGFLFKLRAIKKTS